MDLESECSTLESVEDNELIIPERLANVDENNIENNGSCEGDHKLLDDTEAKDVGVTASVSSPPLSGKSLAGSAGSSPQATIKGYGLKKWRRIKREFSINGSNNIDTSKILKRGLSTSIANSSKPLGLPVETRQKSDGSLSSTNAMLKSLDVATDGFVLHGSSLDSRLAVGPNFGAGTDSENSEDQSSKSSTAASVPSLRYEIPATVAYVHDKNRTRTLSGKNLVNSVQRGQQGKIQIETSKKPRGERIKIEKENSHSSVESDSRSSNFVFMQGTNSVTGNGGKSGRSMSYDGENSDEAQGEQHFGEELQTGYSKQDVGEFEDRSQQDLAADLSWEVKEEKVENHRSLTDQDPLGECILTLQSAQEDLEKEVQKLREIGTEHISLFDGSTLGSNLPSEFASVNTKIHEASSSDLLHSREITRSSSHFLETQVVSLKQNIYILEGKLEEANAVLQVKEAQVVELECALKSSELPKEERWSAIESLQKKYREMEAELESLFKQKIEAEVEYLAISRTIQKSGFAAVDQVMLFEEQKTLASEQAQMLNELGDAESKAAMLKRQAEKLETCFEDIVGIDQVLKLQNRLSPRYPGVVPT